jgi:hypothetical protein
MGSLLKQQLEYKALLEVLLLVAVKEWRSMRVGACQCCIYANAASKHGFDASIWCSEGMEVDEGGCMPMLH